MDIEGYIKDRLEGWRKRYEGKANTNKKQFLRFQRIVIVLEAVIPIEVTLLTMMGYGEYRGL